MKKRISCVTYLSETILWRKNVKKLVKYFEFFLIGLATVILASCDLSLSPPKASTVQIAIKAPLINEFSTPSSRAILGFTGQTLTITITAQDMNPIVQDLPLDPKTNLYSGSFSLPKRVPITFTVEAKDVNNKVYVSAKQTKVITKNNETLSITLAPVLDGTENEITTFTGYNFGVAQKGVVTTIIFTPEIQQNTKEVYTYAALNLAFVVTDKNGKVLSKNNTWTMNPGEQAIILFAPKGDNAYLNVTSEIQSLNVRSVYYVSSGGGQGNTGLTKDDPLTLYEALNNINALTNLSQNEYGEIRLIESITGNFDTLQVKNNVLITSAETQSPVISLTQNCTNIFDVGQATGDPITMTLKNVTLGNTLDEDGLPYAIGGLIKVTNANLVLGSNSHLQYNKATSNAGAVDLGSGAALYMEGGSINSCEGKYAGAIYVGDGAKVYIKDAIFGVDSDANDGTDGKNNIYIASYSLEDLFLWVDESYKNFDSYVALEDSEQYPEMLGIANSTTNMNYLFEGYGTENNPYKINKTNDIYAMSVSVPSTILAKEFKQTDNIDAQDFVQFLGIPEFSGTYDGDGFAITGLSIEPSGGKDNGFFRFLNGATVKNLYLDAKIHPNDPTIDGIYTYGLLAGYAQNSTITNCGTIGTLTVKPTSAPELPKSLTVGGLVGYSLKNTIEQCFSAAYLRADYPNFMGGLVGNLSGGSITNAYVAEAPYVGAGSTSYVGSLVGYINNLSNNTTITNTYASLIPTGASGFVGFIGGAYPTNYTPTSSYQLFTGGTGISATEISNGFTTQGSYDGFDFEDIWTIDEGTSYPYFQSQNQKQTSDFFKPAPTP